MVTSLLNLIVVAAAEVYTRLGRDEYKTESQLGPFDADTQLRFS
jgi:hypothetical protein